MVLIMIDKSSPVRPPVIRLTEDDARHLLAEGLIRTCHANGPSRVGLAAGCDEKTIRNARDEKSMLRIDLALNVLDIDAHAWDELLGAKGYVLHRIAGKSNVVDIIPAAAAAIHQVGMARDPNGPGGANITDSELLAMEPSIDGAIAALQDLKSQIIAAKLRRAA